MANSDESPLGILVVKRREKKYKNVMQITTKQASGGAQCKCVNLFTNSTHTG